MFELAIKGEIASAHFIPGYPGKCKDLHGHTWKIEVYIQHETLDKLGMVADFAELKKQLKEYLGELDHKYLNELPFFKDIPPTTENIAKHIYHNFSRVITPLKLAKVRVWESEQASVIYYE